MKLAKVPSRKSIAAFATACVLAATASSAFAQPAEGWAYQLPREMMSPFCPGRTLSDCPSPQADSLRMWMLVQESAGRSRAEVEEELLERYGDVILAAPRAEGFGIAAYAIPVLLFFAGGGLVLWLLKRFTRAPVESDSGEFAGTQASGSDPDLERIVEEELASSQ